jgi:hypothetical protein
MLIHLLCLSVPPSRPNGIIGKYMLFRRKIYNCPTTPPPVAKCTYIECNISQELCGRTCSNPREKVMLPKALSWLTLLGVNNVSWIKRLYDNGLSMPVFCLVIKFTSFVLNSTFYFSSLVLLHVKVFLFSELFSAHALYQHANLLINIYSFFFFWDVTARNEKSKSKLVTNEKFRIQS